MCKLVTVKKVQENCGDTAVRIYMWQVNTAVQNKIQILHKKTGKELIDVIGFIRLFHLKQLHTERHSGQQLLVFLLGRCYVVVFQGEPSWCLARNVLHLQGFQQDFKQVAKVLE